MVISFYKKREKGILKFYHALYAMQHCGYGTQTVRYVLLNMLQIFFNPSVIKQGNHENLVI